MTKKTLSAVQEDTYPIVPVSVAKVRHIQPKGNQDFEAYHKAYFTGVPGHRGKSSCKIPADIEDPMDLKGSVIQVEHIPAGCQPEWADDILSKSVFVFQYDEDLSDKRVKNVEKYTSIQRGMHKAFAKVADLDADDM